MLHAKELIPLYIVSDAQFCFWLTCNFVQGILQPDMWGVKPSNRWDWDALREMITMNGVRNSLLVAPMPTASTSQILGNNECFEPYTSNIYSRRVLRFFYAILSHVSIIRLGFHCFFVLISNYFLFAVVNLLW